MTKNLRILYPYIKRTTLFGVMGVFVLVTIIQVVRPSIAFADTGSYPWSGATYVDANYDWGYSSCPSNDTPCMAMYGYLSGKKYGEADPWVYYLRNCTSYVAWKINQVYNKNVNGWGNAAQWDTKALSAGYTNDSSPQVGDIAQWGSEVGGGYGHVAYVYAVNSGVGSLDEYNVAGTGSFTSNRTTASNSAGSADHYIHIGSAGPPPSWASRPAAVQNGSNEMDVFKIGGDGNGYVDKWNGSTWSGFGELPAGNLVGDPAVVIWNTEMDVYATGSNGHIYKDTLGSGGTGWSGWGDLGGGFSGDPSVIVYGTEMDVFAHGTDNNVYKDTLGIGGTGWSGWGSPLPGGGKYASQPWGVVYGTEMDVYAKGTDNNVYKNTYGGSSWSGWGSNLGPAMAGNPTALAWGTEMDVYSKDSATQSLLKDTYSNGTGWSGWGSLGGTLPGDPYPLDYTTEMDIFVRSTSGQINKDTFGGQSWSGYGNLGGNVAGDPTAVAYTVGSYHEMDVFAIGADDNTVYKDSYNGSGWTGFTSM